LATVSGHDGTIADCLERISTPTVVVTLGHHGCCARSQGQLVLQPSFKVTPVDTTAAGDTFCGGLVAALAQGADMAQALRQASAAGALACTQLGAQSSIPNATDVTAFMASQATEASPAELDALRTFCGLN
jgi:ribokinase